MAPPKKKKSKKSIDTSSHLMEEEFMTKLVLNPEESAAGTTEAVPGYSLQDRDVSTDKSLDDSENPLNMKPSKEFTSSTLSLSSSKTHFEVPSSPSGRKRSFRNVSMNSPLIPLNNDGNELIEETSEAGPEKTSSDITDKLDDELEPSFVKSMTKEQMQEHVSQCLQLSTENKINSKNAFALKLIDILPIMSKNDTENNFTEMAYQLDAGTKIYAHRVDAVHRDAVKLVESCIFAEKRAKKQAHESGEQTKDSDDEDGQSTSTDKRKGKKKKSKKNIIATNEQISRKPKEKDPRERFVRLDALPGDILEKAKHDPKDLSLTLDKHTPFWMEQQESNVPTTATGQCKITPIGIRNKRLGPDLQLNQEYDYSDLPSLEPTQHLVTDNDDHDICDDVSDRDDNDKECDVSPDISTNQESSDTKELMTPDSLSVLTNDRMKDPSKLVAMNKLFHMPGGSDYHYLKTDSCHWAGPSYWKRPRGANPAGNKKKVLRKKKEPLAIEYSDERAEEPLKPKHTDSTALNKNTTLHKRTILKWAWKKVTYLPDIKFQPESLQKLFHVDLVGQDETAQDGAPPADVDEVANELSNKMECFELSPDSDESSIPSEYKPTNQRRSDQANLQGDKPGNDSDDDMEHLVLSPDIDNSMDAPTAEQRSDPANLQPEEVAASHTAETAAGSASKTASSDDDDDIYEGDNLVPMVKTVKYEPIKYKMKVNPVNMQELQKAMSTIIHEALDNKEEGASRSSITFREILLGLGASEELPRYTRENLTVQMAYFCLLTLASGENLTLKNDETGEVIIRFYELGRIPKITNRVVMVSKESDTTNGAFSNTQVQMKTTESLNWLANLDT